MKTLTKNVILVFFSLILTANAHAFSAEQQLNWELQKYREYTQFSYSQYDGLSLKKLEQLKNLMNKKLDVSNCWKYSLGQEKQKVAQHYGRITEDYNSFMYDIGVNVGKVKALKRTYQIIRTDIVILIARDKRRAKMKKI